LTPTRSEYLVTFGTRGEDGFQDRGPWIDEMVARCKKQGLDTKRFVWTLDRLKETMLYKVYRSWFAKEMYLGMWVWKPFILLDALSKTYEGDIIVLLDSDLTIGGVLKDFYPLVEQYKGVFIGLNQPNEAWTTGDCFYLMGCEDEKYRQADHVWGAVNFLLNCEEAYAFGMDWLTCNLSLELLTSQNKYAPNINFNTTRWVQGMHTNLITKYGFKMLPNSYDRYFNHPPWTIPY
jgi:hypothetical protein